VPCYRIASLDDSGQWTYWDSQLVLYPGKKTECKPGFTMVHHMQYDDRKTCTVQYASTADITSFWVWIDRTDPSTK
jgi:hypothetical protein